MRHRASKYERELKSEERRALIWLGLLAVIVAFYFWLRNSDPNAAPYVNFFCNSPCPHITLYWIPFLQVLIYYWIGYAGCMLIYFSEDFFHRWGLRGRNLRQGARSIGHIFISLYPVTVLTITVLAAVSFLIPAPIQLPYWLLVYEFFAILALWSIGRVTGRRRLLRESLEFAFDGVKVFWRKIRGLRRKFRLRPRATDKL